MHEASVVEELVKILKAKADELHAVSVRRVNLVVGELTGYMEESLTFYYEILSRGSILEGSELAVRYVKPKLRCESCDSFFERSLYSFACPTCGRPGVMTKIGSEFYIESMEADLPDERPAEPDALPAAPPPAAQLAGPPPAALGSDDA